MIFVFKLHKRHLCLKVRFVIYRRVGKEIEAFGDG